MRQGQLIIGCAVLCLSGAGCPEPVDSFQQSVRVRVSVPQGRVVPVASLTVEVTIFDVSEDRSPDKVQEMMGSSWFVDNPTCARAVTADAFPVDLDCTILSEPRGLFLALVDVDGDGAVSDADWAGLAFLAGADATGPAGVVELALSPLAEPLAE